MGTVSPLNSDQMVKAGSLNGSAALLPHRSTAFCLRSSSQCRASAETFEGRRAVIIDGDANILRDEQSSACSRPL
jgi:hypothetical protein